MLSELSADGLRAIADALDHPTAPDSVRQVAGCSGDGTPPPDVDVGLIADLLSAAVSNLAL